MKVVNNAVKGQVQKAKKQNTFSQLLTTLKKRERKSARERCEM